MNDEARCRRAFVIKVGGFDIDDIQAHVQFNG
jgi:hypothetical protein